MVLFRRVRICSGFSMVNRGSRRITVPLVVGAVSRPRASAESKAQPKLRIRVVRYPWLCVGRRPTLRGRSSATFLAGPLLLPNVYLQLYTEWMTPKKLAAFRLDTDVIEGLELKDRTGAPKSEQARPSIRGWLNATPTRTVSTTSQLLVQRTGIHFHNLDREHVAIEIAVENREPATSEPASLRLEAAPFGAFVRWRPLATLAVPAIPPGRTKILRIVVQQPRPEPLGRFSDLVPPALRTASGSERHRVCAVVRQVTHLRAMLRARDAISARSTALPPDILDLLDGAGPHWAGNLNVWIGHAPVERHLAPRLRIHAGRANLAAFCVGDGSDCYAFRVECATAEWGLALYDVMSGASIECSREPGEEPRWHAVPGLSYVLLVVRPPHDCARGEVLVHVTQRSSEKTAVVEFDLDPAAAGPGCYTL